jgi:2-polyprenyl-3-methyl-5-hydroxy-6-metoxy-1,4-benzoquinol methylase
MGATQSSYRYRDGAASCAHEYLLPSLFHEISVIAQDKSLKILDIGCGNGYVAAQIAALGHSVIGVDDSSDGIAIAHASFPGVSSHLAEDLLISDCFRLGGSLDCGSL